MSPEARRRRALATGLAPYLDADAVAEAVALWQRDYADRPRFSLQGYVSELCKRFDLAPQERATLAALLNRSYVLLCERFGPVRADRLLKAAADQVRRQRPELAGALGALL